MKVVTGVYSCDIEEFTARLIVTGTLERHDLGGLLYDEIVRAAAPFKLRVAEIRMAHDEYVENSIEYLKVDNPSISSDVLYGVRVDLEKEFKEKISDVAFEATEHFIGIGFLDLVDFDTVVTVDATRIGMFTFDDGSEDVVFGQVVTDYSARGAFIDTDTIVNGLSDPMTELFHDVQCVTYSDFQSCIIED